MQLIFSIFIFLKRFLLKCFKILLFFRSAPKNFTPDTVVVLKVGGLGDFIFGIPALNLLREHLPNAKIYLITAKSLNGLKFKFSNFDPSDVSNLPWVDLAKLSVDEVIVVNDLSLKMIRKISDLIPRGKNLGIFLLGYPGMTLSSALKKMLFIRLLVQGIVVCVGVDKKLDDRFMRKFQSLNGLSEHKMLGDIDSINEAFHQLLPSDKHLNFKVPIIPPAAISIYNSIQDKNKKNILLIAPSATTTHKQWPLDKFVNLTKELKKSSNSIEIYLIGTLEQFEQAEQAYRNKGFEFKNLCGLLSIRELAALFSIAKGYIGNDGGMSQLAGLIGCPSVIVFNSVEEDWVTHPWRSANGVIRNRTNCSPCYNAVYCPEGHRKCMVDISIESVLSKVNQIILKPELNITPT